MTGFGGRDALGTRTVDRDATIELIDEARRAGVNHFILVSVHQAGPNHPIQLFRDKWAAEEALRRSGLDWTIVRPTAYLETWLGIIGGPMARTGTTRIFGRGRNPINFVSAGDVARVVELAIIDPDVRGTAIEVPGPENLTLDQLAAVVESVLGRTVRKQHLGPTVMRLAGLITKVVNPVLSAQIAAAGDGLAGHDRRRAGTSRHVWVHPNDQRDRRCARDVRPERRRSGHSRIVTMSMPNRFL